ncbi:rhamnulokinase family protein [Microlunatus sp. GCM10028923]|uniref:rhamnulokinase n=1 Tax=Microlunatus sp. GCM10028923 TaxID=3273400 RepID=UPI00360D1E0F
METVDVVAVDLGASGGRAARVRVGDRLTVLAQHRFPNSIIEANGLRWDLDRLLADLLDGCRRVNRGFGPPFSLAVDGWGVDYGLLDREDRLVQPPFSYRDDRTHSLRDRIDQPAAYRRTGIPGQDINTATQLLAEDPRTLARADRLLLLPDLIMFRLTGAAGTEPTIASTTQLFDLDRAWDRDLIDGVGAAGLTFPEVRRHSEVTARVRPETAAAIGADAGLRAVGICSHDTASALVATPLAEPDAAYISCGTWACVGAELDRPVLTEAARLAGFANEQGLDGTVTFHRSAMGLWPLQECLRHWDVGEPADLFRAAADLPPSPAPFDVDDPRLFGRQRMPETVADLCREAGLPVPETRAAVVRCLLDGLAASLARHVADLDRVLGRRTGRLHLVGGGARNALLCQRLADLADLPVTAGPVEATLLGNALVQARAAGGPATLAAMRQVVRRTVRPRTFTPRSPYQEEDHDHDR